MKQMCHQDIHQETNHMNEKKNVRYIKVPKGESVPHARVSLSCRHLRSFHSAYSTNSSIYTGSIYSVPAHIIFPFIRDFRRKYIPGYAISGD